MISISESSLKEMVLELTMKNLDGIKSKFLGMTKEEVENPKSFQPSFTEISEIPNEEVFNDNGSKWQSSELPEGLASLKGVMAPIKLRELMKMQLKVLNMSQKEYADGVGVAPTTISGIWNGRDATTAKKLFLLTEFLDIGDECLAFLKKEYKNRNGFSFKMKKPSTKKTEPKTIVAHELDRVSPEENSSGRINKNVVNSIKDKLDSLNENSTTPMEGVTDKLASKRYVSFNLKNVPMSLSQDVRVLLKKAFSDSQTHDLTVLSSFPEYLLTKTVRKDRSIHRTINVEVVSRFLKGEIWMPLADIRLLCKYLNHDSVLGELKRDTHMISF